MPRTRSFGNAGCPTTPSSPIFSLPCCDRAFARSPRRAYRASAQSQGSVYRASARSRQSLDRASARTPHLCCPLLGPRGPGGGGAGQLTPASRRTSSRCFPDGEATRSLGGAAPGRPSTLPTSPSSRDEAPRGSLPDPGEAWTHLGHHLCHRLCHPRASASEGSSPGWSWRPWRRP